jgi:N-methylhydantoinase B
VAEDVRQGYVSLGSAKARYGVVIDAATGAVDHAATARRRRALKGSGGDRGDTPRGCH